MRKKFRELTKEEIKLIKTSALAEKHKCSDVYVRCVLTGARAAKTALAKLILRDAHDVLAIYNRDTSKLMETKR